MQEQVGVSIAARLEGERWVSLDGSAPGTPASTQFLASESSAAASVFEVVIHGYYLEDKTGPDGQSYTRLAIPGLGATGQIGAPDLPALRLELAVPPNAKRAYATKIQPLETVELSRFNPWPQPYEGVEDAEDRFMKDEKIYGGQLPFPQETARAGAISSKLSSIRGTTAEILPAQWAPGSMALTLATKLRVVFEHPGYFQEEPKITLEREQAARAKFDNWEVINKFILPDIIFYSGDFLFIYPPGYQDELQPLINQKKSRGFKVTLKTTAETGNTCASIRAAMESWYSASPAWRDKFAILVGDVDQIPLCTAPTDVPTDDLYGDADGNGIDDLDEEVYVGRLSVDDEADAATQVSKILGYENSPSLFFNYGRVLLVAHKEGAPGKYVGAHESVVAASYANPPSFDTLYGHLAGVSDANVSNGINSGYGLVAYRGHGSSSAWTGWNTFGDYYDRTTDVPALTNPATRVPVLWSFACNNNELGVNDSVGEVWMESAQRAVAHYGSTVPSYTSQNHELDRQMFKAVYDSGLTTHARAIERGEEQMAAISGASSNAWMYLLLGDPEMRIRTKPLIKFNIKLPLAVSTCPTGGCELKVSVLDELGQPLNGVLVSLFKPGERIDEVHDNRYTNEKGTAVIPASPQTTGPLYVTVRDLAGNNDLQVVQVK